MSLDRNGFHLGSRNGFSVEGVILVLLGLASVGIGVATLIRSAMPQLLASVPIWAGGGMAWMTLREISPIQRLVDGVGSGSGGRVGGSVGLGLWLGVVAAGIAIFAGVVSLTSGSTPPKPSLDSVSG
jgi:hypothetical protein